MRHGTLYCKAVALRTLPDFIRDLGGNPTSFFAKAGLNIAHLKSNNFYDWDKVCHLMNLIEARFNEPSLGIKFAQAVPRDFLNAGPMLALIALVPTMRDFFKLSQNYQALHANAHQFQHVENFETREVECELQIHPLSPTCYQFTEHIMAMMILMMRPHFTEGKFLRLSFQHKPPADLSYHEKIFQCPIEFNADRNVAYMPLEFLDQKLGGRFQMLQPIVKAYLKRKTNKNPLFKTSMAHTVERLLPSIFGLRKSRLPDMAELLGMSPKKLQRLLSEEGENYSDILNNVRCAMAKRLLFESDISITHLANLLDYASISAFNTACQRWVGVSPRQYRKDIRAPKV